MDKEELTDLSAETAYTVSGVDNAPATKKADLNDEQIVAKREPSERDRDRSSGHVDRPRSMRHLDAFQRFSLLRPGSSSNVRYHATMARSSRNMVAAANDQEDRNLARMLEDLLNQREQLERSHNWNQYSAVLKVLDEKLEETRLRLFYGREFDSSFVKKLKRFDDGSDANTATWIDIDIPKDRGGHQNLVGRLVGPSGSTIKQLERDLDCKISIRGWALKRNAELRSGVQRALHEEVDVDDGRELYMKATVLPSSCTRTHLEYAKKALEHFVHNAVTTNADFDVLKKWQLIDLSKGRGQYRPVGRRSHRNDNENKPPKTLNAAPSTPAYDKSVTVPSLSTIQVPVRLIAVPQMPSPTYQLPSMNSMLAVSSYQPCYSTLEFQPMSVDASKLGSSGQTTPSRPVFMATSSSPTVSTSMCSQVADAYGTQTQPSTPINLAVTPTSLGTSTPSSGSVDSACYSMQACATVQNTILSPASVYAPLQSSAQYAPYTQQFAAQSPVQYGQTLLCPLQPLYASPQTMLPAQPCYAAQQSASSMSLNVTDNRYVVLDNTYPQSTYVYYPGAYVTPLANQQAVVQQ